MFQDVSRENSMITIAKRERELGLRNTDPAETNKRRRIYEPPVLLKSGSLIKSTAVTVVTK